MSEDIKRQFQGVWIPAALWLDASLPINEKVMLVELNSLQDPERGCYASNAHFAKFFGLSNSRISELINSLAKKGFVTVELIRKGKQVVERRVRVVELFGKSNTPSEKAFTPIRKTEEPPSENTKGSNTSTNNTKSSKKPMADKPAGAFDLFWSAYPKKKAKGDAEKAWAKVKPDHALAELIIAAVLAQKLSDDWTKDGGKFIPHPATWLNAKRWEDEVTPATDQPAAKPKSSGPDFFDESWRTDTSDDL